MICLIRLNIFLEILIRVVLWWLFVWFDHTEPFIRHINPNELWLYQYPSAASYVPARILWMTIFLFPIIFLAAEYFISGKRDDPITAIMGLTLGYSLNGFLTSILKVMIGRPRPDFYIRCFPNGVGTNFNDCTGNRENYLDGRKSFPSGHSSFAFTCMAFMSLYMARKFSLFSDYRKSHSWQLCACVLPILIAASIAISRTCDYHHHYQDVIAGSMLGTVISCLTYRLYFPKPSDNVAPET